MSDIIRSKEPTDAYREGWDRIFGPKTEGAHALELQERLSGVTDVMRGPDPARGKALDRVVRPGDFTNGFTAATGIVGSTE